MLIGEFTYTACRAAGPFDGNPGWKVRQITGDRGDGRLDGLVRQAATWFGTYRPPPIPQLPTQAQLDALPRTVRLHRLDRTTSCLIHLGPAGSDYTGRPNFFAHARLFATTSGVEVRPAELVPAGWLEPADAAAVEAAELPDPPELPAPGLDHDDLEAFMVARPNRREGLLVAFERAVCSERPLVIVADRPYDVAGWLHLIGQFLLPSTAWALPFSTYEPLPRDGFARLPFRVVGTADDPGDDREVLVYRDGADEPTSQDGIGTTPEGQGLSGWAALAEFVVLAGLDEIVAAELDDVGEQAAGSADDRPLWGLPVAVLRSDSSELEHLLPVAAELALRHWPAGLRLPSDVLGRVVDRLVATAADPVAAIQTLVSALDTEETEPDPDQTDVVLTRWIEAGAAPAAADQHRFQVPDRLRLRPDAAHACWARLSQLWGEPADGGADDGWTVVPDSAADATGTAATEAMPPVAPIPGRPSETIGGDRPVSGQEDRGESDESPETGWDGAADRPITNGGPASGGTGSVERNESAQGRAGAEFETVGATKWSGAAVDWDGSAGSWDVSASGSAARSGPSGEGDDGPGSTGSWAGTALGSAAGPGEQSGLVAEGAVLSAGGPREADRSVAVLLTVHRLARLAGPPVLAAVVAADPRPVDRLVRRLLAAADPGGEGWPAPEIDVWDVAVRPRLAAAVELTRTGPGDVLGGAARQWLLEVDGRLRARFSPAAAADLSAVEGELAVGFLRDEPYRAAALDARLLGSAALARHLLSDAFTEGSPVESWGTSAYGAVTGGLRIGLDPAGVLAAGRQVPEHIPLAALVREHLAPRPRSADSLLLARWVQEREPGLDHDPDLVRHARPDRPLTARVLDTSDEEYRDRCALEEEAPPDRLVELADTLLRMRAETVLVNDLREWVLDGYDWDAGLMHLTADADPELLPGVAGHLLVRAHLVVAGLGYEPTGEWLVGSLGRLRGRRVDAVLGQVLGAARWPEERWLQHVDQCTRWCLHVAGQHRLRLPNDFAQACLDLAERAFPSRLTSWRR